MSESGDHSPDDALRALAQSIMEGVPVEDAPPPSLDELVAALRDFAEWRVPQMDPEEADEGLWPMFKVAGPGGTATFATPPLSAGEGEESLYLGLLPMVAEAMRARAVAALQPMWGVKPEDEIEGMQVRDNPTRREFVVVTGFDGVRLVQSTAPVVAEDPPTLEPWEFGERPLSEARNTMLGPTIRQMLFLRYTRALRIFIATRPARWWTHARREAQQELVRQIQEYGDVHDQTARDAWARLLGERLDPALTELINSPDFWDIKDPTESDDG